MDDDHVLAFVERSGNQAQYVTSVCTGSLVLGAAGLLTGYRAACHWMYRDELVSFGAIPTSERVTCDRNRITGAGVTAGIDLALRLVALVRSEAEAKIIQLRLEYDPEPPFQAGSPEAAGPEIVSTVRGRLQSLAAARRAASLRARSKLISRKKLPEPAA
jgi:cyclohexyl-isocyanide hydratase